MLNVQSETRKNVEYIRVIGRVDGFTAQQLESALDAAIKAKRYKIVVDFSETEFLASAGMRALLHARQQVQDHNGDVRLANMSDFIAQALKLVGLDKLFKIYDNADAALASF